MIICRYVLGFVIIICTKYDLHELTTRQNAHLLNNKKSFNRLWNELPHLARIHFNPKLSMVLKREKETKKNVVNTFLNFWIAYAAVVVR